MLKWLKILCVLVFCLKFAAGSTLTPVDSVLNLIKQSSGVDTSLTYHYNYLARHYKNSEPKIAIDYAYKALEAARLNKQFRPMAGSYNNLGFCNYIIGNYSYSLAYFDSFYHYSKLVNDFPNMAYALTNKGNVFIEQSLLDSTLWYYNEALNIRRQIDDDAGLANLFVNFGYVYKELGNYRQAVFFTLQAARKFEKINHKEGYSYAQDYLAVIFYRIKNFRLSIAYSLKAIETQKLIKDNYGLSVSYHSIGNCYASLNMFDSAVYYINLANEINKQTNDKRQQANALNDLAKVLLKQGLTKQSLEKVHEAEQINLNINNSRGLTSSYALLAEIYTQLNNAAKAKHYLSLVEPMLKETKGLEELRKLYRLTAELAMKQHNYLLAAVSYQNLLEVKDSLFNAQNTKQLLELNTRYETEKKDLQLITQNTMLKYKDLTLERRRLQMVLLVILLLVGVVISFLIIYSNKLKSKAAYQSMLVKQQELKTFAIIEAEEKERIRIAKDLHDGVGQQLAALKFNINAFEDVTNQLPSELKNRLSNLAQIADESLKDLRNVSHNMMPNALIRSGLVQALREFIHQMSANGIIHFNLHTEGLDSRIESTKETIIYRVIQECVSNIVKHANATEVGINLIKTNNKLSLTIDDNGIGFNANGVQKDGIGLNNIISRIEYLKGEVVFDSQPGNGTTVIIEIPLA